MKRITVILLCILLCVCMVGCDDNTALLIGSSPTASTVSATETVDNEEQSETQETESSETTEASSETETELTDTSSTTDTKGASTTTDSSITATTGTSDHSKKPDTSADEKKQSPTTTNNGNKVNETKPQDTISEETKPKEESKPTEETKPTEESKPVVAEPEKSTEPETPADPYAYPFNINQIRQDCIAQGKNYGFKLDESLTPNNSSWSGAETASTNTQGTRLKRFLSELVEYYSPAYRESMGLPEANITAFNIYFEDLGNNTYRIYFLFLL